MSSDSLHNRYDRQIRLPEFGSEGQEKLRNAKVLIVGAGGLGCPAAQYLVAAGIGTLGLIDFDRVDTTNLHRQILFRESDVGRFKVEAAKEVLEAMNSEVEIIAITERLTKVNVLRLFSGFDLIIDGTDNFQTKYLINDACILTEKPLVYASVYKFQGQISVFNYQNGPSYRCLFPSVSNKNVSCEVTGILGILPGLLGIQQATEALKIILGIGEVLSGKLKLMDTLTQQDQLISIKQNPAQIAMVKERGLQLEQILCELKSSKTFYLDVREPFEEPKTKSKNVLNIPLGELPNRHQEIPKNVEVHVFCQTGIRSRKAIELLTTNFGFKNLHHVDDGIKPIIK